MRGKDLNWKTPIRSVHLGQKRKNKQLMLGDIPHLTDAPLKENMS